MNCTPATLPHRCAPCNTQFLLHIDCLPSAASRVLLTVVDNALKIVATDAEGRWQYLESYGFSVNEDFQGRNRRSQCQGQKLSTTQPARRGRISMSRCT